MFAARGQGAPAGRFGGKPGFGPGKSFGKKPFSPRGGAEGFAPRGGEGFVPRERASFDRDASRFEPRAPHGSDAPRSPFDRSASVGRVDHKPAGFAPRKPGAPAGKAGFKPQRPRTGGFAR